MPRDQLQDTSLSIAGLSLTLTNLSNVPSVTQGFIVTIIGRLFPALIIIQVTIAFGLAPEGLVLESQYTEEMQTPTLERVNRLRVAWANIVSSQLQSAPGLQHAPSVLKEWLQVLLATANNVAPKIRDEMQKVEFGLMFPRVWQW